MYDDFKSFKSNCENNNQIFYELSKMKLDSRRV